MDHTDLFGRNPVLIQNQVAGVMADRDHMVGLLHPELFNVEDALVAVIATAVIFHRMHMHHQGFSRGAFGPDGGGTRHPVMRMDQVEVIVTRQILPDLAIARHLGHEIPAIMDRGHDDAGLSRTLNGPFRRGVQDVQVFGVIQIRAQNGIEWLDVEAFKKFVRGGRVVQGGLGGVHQLHMRLGGGPFSTGHHEYNICTVMGERACDFVTRRPQSSADVRWKLPAEHQDSHTGGYLR